MSSSQLLVQESGGNRLHQCARALPDYKGSDGDARIYSNGLSHETIMLGAENLDPVSDWSAWVLCGGKRKEQVGSNFRSAGWIRGIETAAGV